MPLSPKWKQDEDEAIEILSKEVEEEPDWKVVGSPSRRESFSVRVLDSPSPPSDKQSNIFPTTNTTTTTTTTTNEFIRRGSIDNNNNNKGGWGSFGGFQWEGPSIFDEEIVTVPKTPLPPNTPDSHPTMATTTTNSILSVPMLPNISLEPNYRPQRSFSFSMGQEPNLFGYDDYSDMYARSALAPTMEEDEEESELTGTSFSNNHAAAYLRTRSQSSNAVFGLNPASFWNPSIRPNTGTNRRSSVGFASFLSMAEKESLNGQRRMSQPEFNFPDIIPNGSSSSPPPPPPPPLLYSQQVERLENSRQLQQSISSSSSSLLKSSSSLSGTENLMQPSLSTPHPQVETGKGMLLLRLPHHIPLYMVEFKSGRTDFYYVSDPLMKLRIGDLVIVEADRGKDLGKVATNILSVDQVVLLQNMNKQLLEENERQQQDVHVKRIYRLAVEDEIQLLSLKDQDEQKALAVCLQKIKNRKLPMEVVDAEFQWDRRKLTFYFIAERRIDFRELVRELFKMYKTRIWMCAVNPSLPGGKN